MDKVGFLDLDGLIINFTKGACEVHGRENPYADGPNIFEMDKLFGLSKADFWAPMDYNYWFNLEFMPDGLEIFDICVKHFGRENICILTSPCLTTGCYEGKRDWVKTNLGLTDKQLLVGGGKHFCAKSGVLIDDYDKNYVSWIAAEGKAFLFPRLWNSRHDQAEQGLDLLREYLCSL